MCDNDWKSKDLIKYFMQWYDWYWSQDDSTTVDRFKKELYDDDGYTAYRKPTYQPRYFGIAKRLIDKYGVNRVARMIAVSFLLDTPPQDFSLFGSDKFISMLNEMVDAEFVSCLIINPTLAEVLCRSV